MLEQLGHQAQCDQRHGHRVDGDQYGHGHGDQLLQPLVGHGGAEDRHDDHHGAVLHAQQFAEIGRAGADQAHARGQAGQQDHGGQQEAAGGAEGVVDVGVQDLHAAGAGFHHRAAHAAQVDQGHIDQAQAGGGDQARQNGVARVQPGVGHAGGLDGGHDDDAEDQGGQRVHGLVALQEALGQGLAGRGVVGRGRGHDVTGRGHESGDAQDGQHHDQRRGDDLADVVHQLAGEQRQHHHQREVADGEHQQRLGRVAGERGHAHLDRPGGRARRGKEGADRQVDGQAHQGAGQLADGAGQRLQPPAHARQRNHAQQGQAHAGQQKAQGGRPLEFTSGQAHAGRENDVACAQEERKSHEAEGKNVPRLECCHGENLKPEGRSTAVRASRVAERRMRIPCAFAAGRMSAPTGAGCLAGRGSQGQQMARGFRAD